MLWTAFIVGFAATAAISDLLTRRIPRLLTTSGLVVGLGFHLWRGGFWSSLFAAFLGFALGLTLFQLGAIGGGDVKLAAALGALLGFPQWLTAMELALLLAGVIAFVQLAWRGALGQAVRNCLSIVRWIARHGLRPHPDFNVRQPFAVRAPLGVPLAAATCLVVVFSSGVLR